MGSSRRSSNMTRGKFNTCKDIVASAFWLMSVAPFIKSSEKVGKWTRNRAWTPQIPVLIPEETLQNLWSCFLLSPFLYLLWNQCPVVLFLKWIWSYSNFCLPSWLPLPIRYKCSFPMLCIQLKSLQGRGNCLPIWECSEGWLCCWWSVGELACNSEVFDGQGLMSSSDRLDSPPSSFKVILWRWVCSDILGRLLSFSVKSPLCLSFMYSQAIATRATASTQPMVIMPICVFVMEWLLVEAESLGGG